MQAAFDAVAAVGVDVPPGSVVCAAGADFEEATSASAVAFSDPPSLMPFSSSDKLDIECILSKLLSIISIVGMSGVEPILFSLK